MDKLFATACTLSLLVLLEGCSNVPEKAVTIEDSPANTTPIVAEAVKAKPIAVPIEYRNFPTDTLYSLLVAEIAASRQDFDTTLQQYTEQAHITNDKAVIARAARIAQFFREQDQSLEMGLLWIKQQPDNIEANTLVANAYLELNKPLLALEQTEKLLALLHPAPSETSQRDGGAFTETLANFSKRSNKETRALLIQHFNRLLKQYPALTGIKVGLSVLHQANNELDQAFIWVNQALSQEPERISAIVQEVLLLQQSKQIPLAISKLKVHLDKSPNNNHLRLIYARLLTTTDINEAYKQFTLLSEQSPRQLDLKFSRALLATELGKMQEAKPLLTELLSVNYQTDTVGFYLGHTEESLLNINAALDYYLSVKQGDNYFPAQNRAAGLLIKQGKIGEAQTLFANLRTNHPKRKEQLYVGESNLLVQNKADNTALALLNKAINEFPDSIDLRYNRSTLYERRDQLALMESDFRHILAIDPNNVHALNGLGYFLSIRTQRYEEAYALIAKALTLKPGDAAIIDSMGWVAFKMGRFDEALAYLHEAFALYPDPEVAAHLGEVLWAKGQKQEAKNIWETNLTKNPKAPEILETLKRLGVSL